MPRGAGGYGFHLVRVRGVLRLVCVELFGVEEGGEVRRWRGGMKGMGEGEDGAVASFEGVVMGGRVNEWDVDDVGD